MMAAPMWVAAAALCIALATLLFGQRMLSGVAQRTDIEDLARRLLILEAKVRDCERERERLLEENHDLLRRLAEGRTP